MMDSYFYSGGFRYDIFAFNHHGVCYNVTSRRIGAFQRCVEEVYIGEIRAKVGSAAWNTGVEGFRYFMGGE